MPRLIEHIDAIARRKQRPILYLEFHPQHHAASRHYRYQQDQTRELVLACLDEPGIGWQECGPFADPHRMPGYAGQIHLDIACDETLPKYRELRDYLEFADGTSRLPGVRFYVLPLDMANKNAEHDRPGFWEDWANQIM